MEARNFQPLVAKLGIKKASFLNTNNDFGIGAANEFSKMLKASGVEIGVLETMDPKATDFSAQLAKIKAAGGDTLFVTTAVEQNTLILRQAKDLQLTHRIITTGGSNSPDQLVVQAGDAANGSFHTVFFPPWFPEVTKYPDISKRYMDEWRNRGHNVGGLTEGFRGYDGILTIVEAIRLAGKAESAAIVDALWKVKVKGVHGDIAFAKQGPAGKESGQNSPSVYLVKIEGGRVVNPKL
jgi:branched-chain amino acid transport system substrate-binding protein